MGARSIIPDAIIPPKNPSDSSGQLAPGALNAAAGPDVQLQVAGRDSFIPIIYGGPVRTAGLLYTAAIASPYLLLCVLVCEGTIEELDGFELNDEALTGGSWSGDARTFDGSIQIKRYYGAQVTTDPWLAAAISGYTEVHAGTAYFVARIPPGVSTGFPRMTVRAKGLKVSDPRGSPEATVAWSDNPALILADFITNTTYGARKSVDTTSVIAAADYCDAMIGTPAEKRSLLSLVIAEKRGVAEWIDVLRAYVPCFAPDDGVTITLVPDTTRATDHTFDADSISSSSPPKLRKRGVRDTPTVVRIGYTRTDVTPWATDYAEASTASAARRITRIEYPGIQRYSQARRFAIERLNHYTLENLEVEIGVFEEGLKVTRGDVIAVTDDIGLSSHTFRVLDATDEGNGRWRVEGRLYNAAAFSEVVESAPSTPPLNLPNPRSVPTPANIALVETIYLEKFLASEADSLSRGLVYLSRIECSWDAVDYLFPHTYRVKFYDGEDLIHEGSTSSTSFTSPSVQQGRTYTIKVHVRSELGYVGAEGEASLEAVGKGFIPGDVPSFRALFEIGGEVFAEIVPAVDIDIVRYEWRYGPSGSFQWATATLLDRVDTLRTRFKGIPVGTWTLGVKAIDSLGQYSSAALTGDVTVTSDTSAFVQSQEFTSVFTIGSELISDPTMGSPPALVGSPETDGGWALGAGWDIAGGKLVATSAADGSSAAQYILTLSADLTVGALYMVTLTVDAIPEGSVEVYLGTALIGTIMSGSPTDTGTHIFYGECAGDEVFRLTARGVGSPSVTTATIDDISVIESNNIVEIAPEQGDPRRRWATSFPSDAFVDALPNVAMNSLGSPLIGYHTTGISRFVASPWDLGTQVTGDWTLEPNVEDVDGVAEVGFYVSLDGVVWAFFPSTAWKGSARFIAPFIETTGTMIVSQPKITLLAQAKAETGQITTSASGAVLVELAGDYTAAQDLQATPVNTSALRVVSVDRILLHPEFGLMLTWTVNAAGDAQAYAQFSAASRVVVSGDYLEFDVFIDPRTVAPNVYADGGMFVYNATDVAYISPGVDQNGHDVNGTPVAMDALARGAWHSRKCSLAAHVGDTINQWYLVSNADSPGDHISLYRNIRITDGAGTDRLALWATGEPTVSGPATGSLVENGKIGPANSFNVYAYDSSLALVATDVFYSFKGF